MSNMLAVSEEIETKLKDLGLVGKRLGSGFCFIDNSRDVQFSYTDGIIEGIKGITDNYRANIEKVVNEVVSQYDDLKVNFAYRDDNFSYYISPKREPSGDKDDEVCEGEFFYEDPNPVTSLLLRDNCTELLLNVVNYGLAHMTFTADDTGKLNAIQEKLMKSIAEKKNA